MKIIPTQIMTLLVIAVQLWRQFESVMLLDNTRNFGIFILFLTFLVNTDGWRPFKLIIKNITSESSGPLATLNASLSTSGGISIWMNVLDTINHPFAQTEVYIDSGNGKFDTEILNRTVNLCEFFRNKLYEPLLQILYKMMLETGPWPTSCPIRKSKFSIENFHFDLEKLPPYLPEKRGFLTMAFKNLKNNILEDISSMTIFFEVENVGVIRLKSIAKKHNIKTIN